METSASRCGPGAIDVALEPAPEHSLEPLGRPDERFEIDAGSNSFTFEEVDEVLRRDVPGGPGCEGASAEAAARGVEHARARLERGERIRIARVARVVEVHAAGTGALDERPDLRRRGDTDRVREDDLGTWREPRRDRCDHTGVD